MLWNSWYKNCKHLPKNPIPETICAAILDFEAGSTSEDIKVKSVAPHITIVCVLMPASFPLLSRSAPITYPKIVANKISIKNFPSILAKNPDSNSKIFIGDKL